MITVKTKDVLSLTYTALTNEGKNVKRSSEIRYLDYDLVDEDFFEIASLLKNMLKYNVDDILRKSEVKFLED